MGDVMLGSLSRFVFKVFTYWFLFEPIYIILIYSLSSQISSFQIYVVGPQLSSTHYQRSCSYIY